MARGGASEVFVPRKRSCPEGSGHCLPPHTLSARSRACFDAAETEEGRNPRKLTRDQCRAPSDRPQIFKARKPQPEWKSPARAPPTASRSTIDETNRARKGAGAAQPSSPSRAAPHRDFPALRALTRAQAPCWSSSPSPHGCFQPPRASEPAGGSVKLSRFSTSPT